MRRTSEYFFSDKKSLLNKISQYGYRDYLLFSLFYSNSITIFLQYLFLFDILSAFSDCFFSISNSLYLYSMVILNRNIIPDNDCLKGNTDWFSYYFDLGIKIRKYLNISLSYLMKMEEVEEIFNSNYNTIYNEDILCLEKERELIEQNLLNKELIIDFPFKILSLLSSLFKNNRNFCMFFSNFVN